MTAGCSAGEPTETAVSEDTPTQTRTPTPEPTPSPTPTAKPPEESCAATEPVAPSSEKEWWPMFQHDTRNSGYNPDTTGPTEEVGSAWTFETGGKVQSSPAVDAETVYVGSHDGNLYALGLVTGEEVWSFETDGPVESSPAVVDGLVYVGSHDHNVYAVDAATGEQQWAFETGGPVRSSPTVAKDLINAYTPEWREHGMVAIGSDDGNGYILDGKTGEEKYHISTSGPIVSAGYISTYYYISSGDGPFLDFAFGSTDGTRDGTDVTTRGPGGGDQGRPFVPPYNIGSPIYSSLTVNDDPWDTGTPDIFGTDAGTLHHRYLEACDVCEPTWEFQTGDKIRASPALAKDPAVVFVGSWDGSFYAVNVETGEKRWKFETNDKIESSPAVVGDAVYFGSGDHHVYALDRQSGDKLWDFRTGGSVFSSPAVVDGTVFVGSDDGHVYALTACQ